MELEVLRKMGLSEGEIKVYSALLELGPTSINRINERTSIERRNIYDILNKLIEKGLVAYFSENKRKVFRVTHPSKIIGYLEEKIKEIEITRAGVKAKLPEILNKFNSGKSEVNAEVYRGREGLKAVFEEMLNYKENFFIGSGRYVVKFMPVFWNSYNKRRTKLGVKWINLCRGELKGKIKPLKLESVKFLPREFSANPAAVFIYGNRVANVLWEENFFAFVVESRQIAENYKKYHAYLWEKVASS